MTAARNVTIWCDHGSTPDNPNPCGEWYGGDATTAKDARSDARLAGWDVGLAGGRDLCRRHKSSSGVSS